MSPPRKRQGFQKEFDLLAFAQGETEELLRRLHSLAPVAGYGGTDRVRPSVVQVGGRVPQTPERGRTPFARGCSQ
jgi:hypothetical protein